jgi:hypothetical protein
MLKSSLLGLAALAVLSAGTPAAAQTAAPAAGPEPYTMVAQWQVPRAQWATFVADFDKNTRPILEKLSAGGGLISWGAFESIVHTPDGYSHGVWWTGTTYAAMEKARRELVTASAASTSLANATGHRDFFLRSIVYASKPASGEGYLTVSSYLLKAGKGQEWKQLWDKNTKPVFDDLLAKGSLTGYSIDVEDVHTDSPMWRMVVTVSPSAEADDQFGAAFDAASAKLTADERRTRALTMDALLEPGAHRDMYARIIRYWHK